MEQNVMKMMEMVADQTMALAKENTVLGDPIEKDGITVIPISRLTAGFAGGGADVEDSGRRKSRHPAGGGAKVTRTPVGFLVIGGGEARIVRAEASAETSSSSVLDTVIGTVKEWIDKKKEEK